MLMPEWTTCFTTGRRRYASRADAETVLAHCQRLRAAGHRERQERAVESCTHCRGWHVVRSRHCPVDHKICYPSRRDAEQALHLLQVRLMLGDTQRHERTSYRCPHCQQWHLTSQQRTRKRKETAA